MDSVAFEQAERGLRTSLSGDLRTWSAYDLLCWLVQTRRSALLSIGRGLSASKVFVRQGQIFRVEHGDERGEGALFSLLLQLDGEFQLLLRPPPDAHANVLSHTDELLNRAVAAINAHNAELRASAAS